MPRIVMSQRALEVLKPTDRQVEYYDVGCRGLALRVSPRSKTWVFSGRVGGRATRITLGSFPGLGLKSAREAAEKVRHQIRQGQDPAAERRKQIAQATAERDQTFAALTERFVDVSIRPHRRPRSIEGYTKIFRSQRLSAWASRPISTIRRADQREK